MCCVGMYRPEIDSDGSFSSYCTILMLVYAYNQCLISEMPVTTRDIELAHQCLEILEFCAAFGETAGFLNTKARSIIDQILPHTLIFTAFLPWSRRK